MPYDQAIWLLGNHQGEAKSYVHTKTCMGMYTVTLFIIIPNWKQPKCLAPCEWVNKLWYISTVEYNSATKESKPHTTIWMNLKCIFLSERIWYSLKGVQGVLGGSSGKEPTCQCRRCNRCRFDPWVGKIPWRRARQPIPVFLSGESPWTEEPGRL